MWNKLKEFLKGVEDITDSDESKKQINEIKKSVSKLEEIEDRFSLSNRLQEISKTGNEETLLERMNRIGKKTIEIERNKRYENYFKVNQIKEDEWEKIFRNEKFFYFWNNDDVIPYTPEKDDVDWDEFNRIISSVDKEYEKNWKKIKRQELIHDCHLDEGYFINFENMELEYWNITGIGETREGSFYWIDIDEKNKEWFYKEKYHSLEIEIEEDVWGKKTIYSPKEYLIEQKNNSELYYKELSESDSKLSKKLLERHEVIKLTEDDFERVEKWNPLKSETLEFLRIETLNDLWEKWNQFHEENPQFNWFKTEFVRLDQ